MSQLEKLREQVTNLKSQLELKQKKLKQIIKENISQKKKIHESYAQELQSERIKLKQHSAKTAELLLKLQNSSRELQSLRVFIAQKEEELTEFRQENQQQSQQIDQLKCEKRGWKSKYELVSIQKGQLETQLKRLKKKNFLSMSKSVSNSPRSKKQLTQEFVWLEMVQPLEPSWKEGQNKQGYLIQLFQEKQKNFNLIRELRALDIKLRCSVKQHEEDLRDKDKRYKQDTSNLRRVNAQLRKTVRQLKQQESKVRRNRQAKARKEDTLEFSISILNRQNLNNNRIL